MPIEVEKTDDEFTARLETKDGVEMHARYRLDNLEICLRGDFNFTWSYGEEDIDDTITFLLHVKYLLLTCKQKEA